MSVWALVAAELAWAPAVARVSVWGAVEAALADQQEPALVQEPARAELASVLPEVQVWVPTAWRAGLVPLLARRQE